MKFKTFLIVSDFVSCEFRDYCIHRSIPLAVRKKVLVKIFYQIKVMTIDFELWDAKS